MKKYLSIVFILIFITGCATWDGVKEDSNDAWKATKKTTNEVYESTKDAIHKATE